VNNIARGKPASQNSDAVGYSGSARLAVDGFRYTDPARKSMALTPSGSLTWWSVDLLETYHVRRMVVVNRDDEKGKNVEAFKNYNIKTELGIMLKSMAGNFRPCSCADRHYEMLTLVPVFHLSK
jgi:hypothetical protein